MSNSKGMDAKKLIGDFLFIPMLTLILYIATYSYEFGIASLSNIPFEMISVTSSLVFSDMLSCIMIFVVMIPTLITCYYVRINGIKKALFSISLFTMGTIICLSYKIKDLYPSIIIMSAMFLWIIIVINNIKNKESSPIDLYTGSLSVFTIVFILFYSYGQIYSNDELKKGASILKTKEGKDYVILRVYGDNLFLKEIQPDGTLGPVIYAKNDNVSPAQVVKFTTD